MMQMQRVRFTMYSEIPSHRHGDKYKSFRETYEINSFVASFLTGMHIVNITTKSAENSGEVPCGKKVTKLTKKPVVDSADN